MQRIYIPHEIRESTLYGTPFEIKLKNKLTQKAIAKECAEWVKEKVKFKSNISNCSIQNFISISGDRRDVLYMPVEKFTTGELGYENDNAIFKFITKVDEPNNTAIKISYAKKLFNELSTSNVKYHEVDSYQKLLAVMSSMLYVACCML